ncbi:glycosyltransferase family 2 protein [Halorubrum salsamenti]|uniref:glycosyltransferase family 2 protein n=1 Tax=Halorubrum salsamenti TaxID=2583990 RepID=UPI0011AA4379|nr:glycosyltransferase family 2 protein [Halorubrum salsamenti]
MNKKTRRRLRPLGVDFLPRPVGIGIQLAMETYFSWRTPSGRDVMTEEWDLLVILDGCRFDMFERQNWIDGDLSARTSLATATPQFLERTFDGKTYEDTVYVTANPMHRVDDWCPVDLDDVFHDIVDVWETDWDDGLGTLPPAAMASATKAARDRYPDHRIITHFVQPHYPFIGPLGKRLAHGRMRGKRRAEGESSDADERPVWDALRDGAYSTERVRQAYEENLWLVLPYVQELIDALDERIVVTSDHGNHVGEVVAPFPVRLFGHPPGIRTPALVTVPWLTVTDDRTKPNPPEEASDSGAGGGALSPAETAFGPSVDGDQTSPRQPEDSGEIPPAGGAESPSSRARPGPLVSVVIPTSNRNERLATAIESVRDQRYAPVETIVVDDSGTGNARPVAERYDTEYVEHTERRGANRARTHGIEIADGRHVQLLDDDDRLHPEKLSSQVPQLERTPDVGVAFCGYASDEGVRLPDPGVRGDVLEESLQFGPKAWPISTMLISASVLDDLLPLRDRTGADNNGLRIGLSTGCKSDSLAEALVYKGDD